MDDDLVIAPYIDEELANVNIDWSEYETEDDGFDSPDTPDDQVSFSGEPTQTEAMDWFNEYGPDASSLVQFQLPDFEDVTLWIDEPEMVPLDLLEQSLAHDPVDDEYVLQVDAELAQTAEEVPYEWRYWEHQPDEFVDNSPSAPPEPGDVDPVTGEMVQ